MIKKISILISTFILLQIFILPVQVQAADKLQVLDSSAAVDFPDNITFSLTAESNADITDIRLHYYVERRSYAKVISEVYIDFTHATRVSAEWSWDMRKIGGLPPGTDVQYWWSLVDVSGNRIETTPTTVSFDDKRYDWKSMNKDSVTLYWYKGDNSFADELLTAAVEGMERLYENTGVLLNNPVEIYIYANSGDLQTAMIFPQTWTGGVAYPAYSTVAIGIDTGNLEWGTRTIVHELTHLVVHQKVYNPYLDLPTWLDEGLSMNMEGPLSSAFDYYLTQAIKNDTLLSVRSLVSPFSAYADQSYLSYAESYGLVYLLINMYGQGKMLELLTVLGKGTEYDAAFEEIYGFDMDGFNEIWLEYIDKVYLEESGDTENSGYFDVVPMLSLTYRSWSL